MTFFVSGSATYETHDDGKKNLASDPCSYYILTRVLLQELVQFSNASDCTCIKINVFSNPEVKRTELKAETKFYIAAAKFYSKRNTYM